MGILTGPVVVLDGPGCEVLGRQLAEAIQLGYVARGRPPPHALLDFADQVNRAARGSAGSGSPPSSAPAAEPGRFRPAPVLPSSAQPAWLTVAEAARVSEVSTSYLRRLVRRREIEASRGGRSAGYLVRADSLDAWLASRRRKEDERKAA